MPPSIFRHTQGQRSLQGRRRERAVDGDDRPGLPTDRRNPFEVDDAQGGIGRRLEKQHAAPGDALRGQSVELGALEPDHLDTHVGREGFQELDRPSVQLALGCDPFSRLHEGEEGRRDRCHARTEASGVIRTL